MKKIFFFSAFIAVAMFATSCGPAKKATVATTSLPTSVAPFGEVYSIPCEVYDTDTEFAATGIYRGSSYQKGECQLNALENAKQLVYAKFKHTYNGMISNYSNSIGNNRGNDIETKLERAGDQVVKAILNDIQACCVKFSGVQADGNIECYVAIKVPKTVIADRVTKTISDNLTQDEKDRINFNEYNYRKEMEERMKNYREEK
ncbi:MAG: hypothetical protein KBT27_14135 [Prevotellaceae bacterium]|nr:hypothetical protein [Candidatus Faecinaster equi]